MDIKGEVELEEEEETEEATNPKEESKRELNHFEKAIKEYIDDFASKNSYFLEKINNEKKSIEKCCKYICAQVRKLGVVGMCDDDVYKLARDYYEDDIKDSELQSYSASSVVINKHVELTAEEKEAAKKEALEQYKRKVVEDEQKRIAKEKEKEAKKLERKMNQEKLKAEQEKEQASLFDFM